MLTTGMMLSKTKEKRIFMKIVKNILLIFAILLFLYFWIVYVLDLPTIIMQTIYPQKYSESVEKYAKEYQVDPLLIFAMIKIESNFNENAKSSSDARGLMQLMENTAIEIENKIEKDKKMIPIEALYEPDKNIELGTYYFASLLNQYDNVGVALAAYNAGMGRVDDWIEQGIIYKDGSNLENIPYKETNMYVRKVLNTYQIYQELYSENSDPTVEQ